MDKARRLFAGKQKTRGMGIAKCYVVVVVVCGDVNVWCGWLVGCVRASSGCGGLQGVLMARCPGADFFLGWVSENWNKSMKKVSPQTVQFILTTPMGRNGSFSMVF